MAKVSPEEEYYANRRDAAGYSYQQEAPGNQHHVPNLPHHPDDQRVSLNQNRDIARFERYVGNPGIQRQRGGGGGRPPPTMYAPRHYTPKEYHYEGQPEEESVKNGEANSGEEQHRSFIQCDCVAFLIILAWVVAMCSLVLGSIAYKKDSEWNDVVNGKKPFPKISKESYFSDKKLYFSAHDKNLVAAKKHMLRDDQWLELAHLIYLGIFLFCTLFQFGVYISRGKENHANYVKFYYAGFGLIGIIMACFPYSSWKTQETTYARAAKHLHEFATHEWGLNSTKNDTGGLNYATANDAHRLATTIDFCKKASAEGLVFNSKPPTVEHFGLKYTLDDLQELGLCTHNRFKIACSVLTLICAALCCFIPFIYCLEHKDENVKKKAGKAMMGKGYDQSQRQMYPQPQHQPEAQQQPPMRSQPPPEEQRHHHHRRRTHDSNYTHDDGTPLTEGEVAMVNKFTDFIEADEE